MKTSSATSQSLLPPQAKFGKTVCHTSSNAVLNSSTDLDKTTAWGSEFQLFITLWVKKQATLPRCTRRLTRVSGCPLSWSPWRTLNSSVLPRSDSPVIILKISIRSPRSLLLSSENNPVLFTPSSYCILRIPSRLFVKRCWTPSKTLESFLYLGHQACTQYSRWGSHIRLVEWNHHTR